jgi:putative cell wall-binding protein
VRTSIRRFLLASCLSLVAAVVGTGGAAALSLPDQLQENSMLEQCVVQGAPLACPARAAQTFTVAQPGLLTDIGLLVGRTLATTTDIAIEIRAGGPTGMLLATSEPVAAADIPTTPDWVYFTLSVPVAVQPGNVLAIVIPAGPPVVPPQLVVLAWGRTGDAYAGGSALLDMGAIGWQSAVPAGDFAFVTYVQTPVARLAGPDRYATSAEISFWHYPVGQPVVYIATGTNFPDALAGAAAAGHDQAPLLLVNGASGSIHPWVAEELDLLEPGRIVVLGGAGAVSPAIVAQLQSYAPTSRISGTDRYSTAVAISQATYPTPAVETVYLATGTAFPDALAVAAVAGSDDAPLLLVPGPAPNLAGVPSVIAELTRLGPDRIVLIGGPGAVSPGIEAHIRSLFPAISVERISGADRYATAAAISAASFAGGGHPVVYAATGRNFPDALAGAALAGADGAPLLLVPGDKPDLSGQPAVGAELARLGPEQVVIFGGPGAVSDGIAGALAFYVTP